MITSRQKKIIQQLAHHQGFMTVEQLAKQFEVSQRTIRHDVLMLESNFLDKDICFVRNRKLGIKLDIDCEEWQQLHSNLNEKTEYLSPESRMKEISKVLLESSEVAFEQLLENFKISDKTLISDLSELKGWFNSQQLKLIREKGMVKVTGREFNKRKAYLYIIKEEATEEKVLDYILNKDSKVMNILQWKGSIQPKDMHYLFEIVSDLEKSLSVIFSDNGYVALLLHLFLSIERLKKEHHIAMDKELLLELQDTVEFCKTEDIVRERIEPYFHIQVPLSEIGYITQHILSAQKEYQKDQEDEECLDLAKKIVIGAEKSLSKPLLTSEHIIESLAMHLKPAIYRARYNIKITNPLFAELQKEYKHLLDTIIKITNEVLASKGIQFDEQEASYIAMHIGAGLEQNYTSPIKRIAIVCSSGIGTVNILQRRLRDIFPQINIVKKCSYKDLKNLELKEVDLVISTIDIYYSLPMPWIKVSPLLNPENQQNIAELLGMTEQREAKDWQINNTVEEIISIVQKNSEIKNKKSLTKELVKYFKEIHQYRLPDPMGWTLGELLPLDSIKLMVDTPSTVSELISLGTQPLKNRGKVGTEYEEKLVKIMGKSDNHFVITEGVLFPHASNETGVWGTGFSLVTLNKPFIINEIGTSIWIMITLAAEDREKHGNALAVLINALNDETFLELLKNTHIPRDIWDWLKKSEDNCL